MPEQSERWTRATLPRPFQDDPWKGEDRAAARTLWDWHQGLHAAIDAKPMLQQMRSAAEDVCMTYGLDLGDVHTQEAAAKEFAGPIRFTSDDERNFYSDRWTGAHARLLGGLAGVGRYTWQGPLIFMLARGYALTAALMVMSEDLAADRVLIPTSDLEQAGTTPDELRRGVMTPAIRKVIWKEVVRARDSFAQAQKLVEDLDRKQAAAFRRWWFAGLEMLNVIEAQDFDVFSRAPRLSRYRRLHARYQARFGRTTFR